MSNPSYDSDEPLEAHVAALLQAFPRLFQKGSRVGVSFPSGWSTILHDLCSAIDRMLSDAQASQFRVEQVKEKFGSLRFYYSVAGKRAVTVDIIGPDGHFRASAAPRRGQPFPTQVIDDLIAGAEKKSATTCITCGSPGVLRRQGWHHVSCHQCVRSELI